MAPGNYGGMRCTERCGFTAATPPGSEQAGGPSRTTVDWVVHRREWVAAGLYLTRVADTDGVEQVLTRIARKYSVHFYRAQRLLSVQNIS